MMIIGHRGAAGLAPENTLEALAAGYDSGADMLEFDIRMTKDNVLVLVHDSILLRTHGKFSLISRLTYQQLLDKSNGDIVRLEEVLDRYFGKIMLCIELKSRGTGKELVKLLTKHYINEPEDWQKILIASFKSFELASVRKQSSDAQLSQLHHENAFTFVAINRALKLSAVGFHRHYASRLAVEIARKSGIFVYVYTLDKPELFEKYETLGAEGIVTNYPDRFLSE